MLVIDSVTSTHQAYKHWTIYKFYFVLMSHLVESIEQVKSFSGQH
jgi:hypothetical protein